MKKQKVLICANPDLNYIDGSSIWLQTITLALSKTGEVDIDFVAKSTPQRDELYKVLKQDDNINIIDGVSKNYWNGKGHKRLSLPMMAELAIKLNDNNNYDMVVVRGFDIAKTFLNNPKILSKCWIYLTDIPQNINEYDEELIKIIKKLALNSNKILCQTEGFKNLWREIEPTIADSKIKIYTPVIPDFEQSQTSISKREQIAIYAGKYKNEWKTLEMVQSWSKIYTKLPNSSLIMIGDKIHNDPFPENFAILMQEALQNTPQLKWLGALSRENVYKQLQKARVGLSWRDESLNDIVEYSTKILEYGSAGCASILNRNFLHESLLGKDYPLYANSKEEFEQKLLLALTDNEVCQKAADRLKELATKHTFSSRVKDIKLWLNENKEENKSKTTGKKVILVAGHDLKFFTLLQKKLEETKKYTFLIDQWDGHNKHDEDKSQRLLEQADIIFCEWCLGNLKWYSHHKKTHQKLVARFHLQEKDLPYLEESRWDGVDHIGYVSDYIWRAGQQECAFIPEKTSVIANLLDDKKFTSKKKTGDARYTLGIVGVSPARKRLDKALDLLEELLKEDSRYCLRIKGKHPLDYDWLLKREDELEYYTNIFKRINSSDLLRYKVIFDPAGDDVNDWLSLVGFVLSPSDFESFHMAVGEGMLTGSIPVIWNWEGANEIWSKDYVVQDINQAKDLILSVNSDEFVKKQIECRKWVLENYSVDNIVGKWMELIDG